MRRWILILGGLGSVTVLGQAEHVTVTEGGHNRLKLLARQSQAEVNFYGRLVDQVGEPVPPSVVKAGLVYWDAEGEHTRKVSTTSDQDGRFAFRDLKGTTLYLLLNESLVDYQYSARGQGVYDFAPYCNPLTRHQPDPQRPVKIEVWKKLGPVELVQYTSKYLEVGETGPNGLVVDLAQFQKDLAGDLKVQLEFGSEISRKDGEYSWRVRYEIPSGGLVPAGQALYPFLAPEAGYQTAYEYVQWSRQDPRSRGEWTDMHAENFYIKSHEGQVYGHLEFKLWLNHEGMRTSGHPVVGWFQMRGLINENGSRNLEDFYQPKLKPRRLRKS